MKEPEVKVDPRARIKEPDAQTQQLANDINTLATGGYFKVTENLHLRRFGNSLHVQLCSDHPSGAGQIFIPSDSLEKLANVLYLLRATQDEANRPQPQA